MIKKYHIILLLFLFIFTGCFEQQEIIHDNTNDIIDNTSTNNSDIVQATMRVSADINDALKQTFFSPAIATNGGSLTYTWNFDDGVIETTSNNLVTHTYNRYGKTYKVELKLENSISNTKKYAYLDVVLEKPDVFMNCDTNGLKMFCVPLISEASIDDALYTWDIYDKNNTLLKTINSTGGASINYTFSQSGEYKIHLTAKSSKVEGDMTADNQVFVSDKINQGDIVYNVISEDRLTYEFLFYTSSASAIEYCWDFDNSSNCINGQGFSESLYTNYGTINHSYEIYEPFRLVTAYARLKDNHNEMVSKKVIVNQDMPQVTINVSGTGFDRTYTPDFNFMPKGNIIYIWNTGDDTEYSTEQVFHTYKSAGLYEVNLNVISDKFSSSIESIKAEPVTVQISDNIKNLVINYNIVKQEQSGETYSFSTPAYTTTGKLYYIWKINNKIIKQGEDLSSIQYKFEKYGEENSISLEVEHIAAKEKASAEPLLLKTTTPFVKLYPPQAVIKDIKASFSGEVKDINTDTDFTPVLLNPKYELEVAENTAVYSLSPKESISLDYTFNTTGTKTVTLKVTADNLLEPVYSAPVSVQVNEVVVTCDFTAGDVNKFSVTAKCSLSKTDDTLLQYHLFYREEIGGEIKTISKNAQETAEMTFYMNMPGKLFQFPSRDILIFYEIGKDGVFPNYGYIHYTYNVIEREMGNVADIIDSFQRSDEFELPTYKDNKGVTYALSQNGYVYSWGMGLYAGNGQLNKDTYVLKPKRITSINEEISSIEKIDNKIIFNAKNNINKYIFSSFMPYCITNISSSIKRIANGFILTANNEVYYTGIYGNNRNIEAVKVSEIKSPVQTFIPSMTNVVYISTTDGLLYRLNERNNNNKITYNIEEISSGVLDYKVRNTLEGSNHVFVLKNDKKLYHKAYLYNETNTGNGDCVSGIGSGLDKTAYETLTPVNIESNITKFYSYPLSVNLDNYLMIAIGEDGAAYRWGCNGADNTIDKEQKSKPQKFVINNEKIIEYSITEHDLWDNFVYVLTDKNNFYELSGSFFDNPEKITVPNNDVITKIHRWYIKYAETKSGNFYKISWNRKTVMLLINNFKNYSSALVPYYYYGGSYILKDNSSSLYGLGWNDYLGKQYLLGLGDIEFTQDMYGENTAVKLSVPEKVKNMYTISKNGSSQSSMVFTESGKIYVWGANAGLLPLGHANPVKTPVLLNLPANIKKFLWNEDASLDAQVFSLLTEDGKVYSWGKNNLTGTDSKSDLSSDGYLMVPALVN